jgi:hypothetical protein
MSRKLAEEQWIAERKPRKDDVRLLLATLLKTKISRACTACPPSEGV